MKCTYRPWDKGIIRSVTFLGLNRILDPGSAYLNPYPDTDPQIKDSF